MRRFPKFIVVFTGIRPNASVVFYQLTTEDSYRHLLRFIQRHPEWEITTGWNSRRFHTYRVERLKQGLETPFFRETAHGWTQISEPRWPLAVATHEERRFVPSAS